MVQHEKEHLLPLGLVIYPVFGGIIVEGFKDWDLIKLHDAGIQHTTFPNGLVLINSATLNENYR